LLSGLKWSSDPIGRGTTSPRGAERVMAVLGKRLARFGLTSGLVSELLTAFVRSCSPSTVAGRGPSASRAPTPAR
jgi:hypothetical protein